MPPHSPSELGGSAHSCVHGREKNVGCRSRCRAQLTPLHCLVRLLRNCGCSRYLRCARATRRWRSCQVFHTCSHVPGPRGNAPWVPREWYTLAGQLMLLVFETKLGLTLCHLLSALHRTYRVVDRSCSLGAVSGTLPVPPFLWADRWWCRW